MLISQQPKKGANALVLNETILISRLKPIGLDGFPVNLPRAELNQMASRWFMSSTYGGSMHTTFSSVAPKRVARHGIAHFMYLNLKYHPYAPQVPGGGGLWFNPSPDWHGDPMDHVQRIFTRDGKMAMWQYMGQYEIRAAPALSIEEWLGLSEKVFLPPLIYGSRFMCTFRQEKIGRVKFVLRSGAEKYVPRYKRGKK